MADFEEFAFDDSKIIGSLQKILALSKEIGETNEGVSDDMKKSYEDLGGAVADVEKQMEDLQAELKKHQAETRKSKSENVELKKSFGDLIGDVKVFGVSIKGAVQALQGKAQAIKGVTTGVSGLSKGMNILKVAIISTGIGALVVLLGTLVAWFTKTQKGVDQVSKVMAGLGAVIDVITDRITKIGGAIVKVFSGDFKGAFKDAKDAVSGLNEELKKEIGLAVQLEQRAQKLRDAQRALGVETAQSRLQIKQLNLTVEDTSKAIKTRLAAAEEAGKIEKGLLDKRLASEKEELQILLDKAALRNQENILAADDDEVANARIKLANTESESLELQTTLQNKKNGLLTEQAAKIKEAVEAQKALKKELEEAVKAFVDQAAELERAQLDPAERIKAEEAVAIAAVEAQLKVIEEKAKAAKIEVDLSKEKEAVIQAIQLESEKKQIALIRKSEEDKRKARQELYDLQLNDHTNFLLLLNTEQVKAADEVDKAIKGITKKYGESIKEGANQPEGLNAFQLLGKKLQRALGFSNDEEGTEQFAQFAAAISSTIGSIFDGLTSRIQGQLEENQAWIDDIHSKQDELKESIEAEERRRDEGLAYNLTGKQEELAELAKMEEKALKEQAELRKKAAAVQAVQDGITQASSLVTMAANTLKGFSEIPILGVALGFAAVAAMFAFFSSAKGKAKESARGFEGGYLGDILGPNASTEDEPHRGRGAFIHPDIIANAREYLVNGDSTAANFDHLAKLNSGIYDGVDLDGFLSQFSPDDIAHGFNHRQGVMDSYSAVNASRMIRHTVRGEMASHTRAIMNSILNKPEHIAVSKGDTIRTYVGEDIKDMQTV